MTKKLTYTDDNLHLMWWGMAVEEMGGDCEPLWAGMALSAIAWQINDYIVDGKDSPELRELREHILREQHGWGERRTPSEPTPSPELAFPAINDDPLAGSTSAADESADAAPTTTTTEETA